MFRMRRLLVLAVVAIAGAALWSVADRFLVSVAAGPVAPAICTVPSSPQRVSLVSAERAIGGGGSAAGGLPSSALQLSATSSGYCGQVYVARPGDTLWGIAVRYSGDRDPRPLADSLEAQIRGGVLQPGQRLAVP